MKKNNSVGNFFQWGQSLADTYGVSEDKKTIGQAILFEAFDETIELDYILSWQDSFTNRELLFAVVALMIHAEQADFKGSMDFFRVFGELCDKQPNSPAALNKLLHDMVDG